ncbi:MAG: copper resistance protein NlpE [Bacteroidia bacterium]|nr:copper resistance protein NlpE [Bacteroidia bacterium]
MKLFLVLTVIAAMVSCTGQKKTDAQQQDSSTVASDMHTSEMVLDYKGVYEGTLPCADCEGIKTTLTVNEDNTFVLISEYLGKKGETFEDKGTYFIEDGEVLVIQDEEGDQKYFKLMEGSLAQLDADKKMIEGEMAPLYVLTKVQ